jgi:polysaccharide biosynthesis protein PslG
VQVHDVGLELPEGLLERAESGRIERVHEPPERSKTPWNAIRDAPESLRDILSDHGSASLPIWITEFGAPTGGPGTVSDGSPESIGPTATHVTEARQAEIARDSVAATAADPGIAALIWYGWRDLGVSDVTSENFYGLRRADGAAKPALAALRDAVASPP